MTKEEFVEMLTIMFARSKVGEVLAFRTADDVGKDEPEYWGSLLVKAFDRLCVDDSDDVPTREGGVTSTPLYELDKIDTWPEGLFEKLSGYIWWIDPKQEINLLDFIASRVGITE